VLNSAQQSFKASADETVMERAMEARSGMPVDVTRHAEVQAL
jgi:L,D-transpeptidase YcfS